MVWISKTRFKWHTGPSGRRYRSRKAQPVSYGPFKTIQEARAWANLKGVLHFEFSGQPEKDNITIKQEVSSGRSKSRKR